MDIRYPKAKWHPLGDITDQRKIGTPRIFIIHTMSGYLNGTDSFFKQNGYGGTESHFGVGGNFDPPEFDGMVYQWQVIDRSADAQFAGNAYATSVETSDGNHDNVRWSSRQAESIIQLGVWWCQQTGRPARLVSSPDESGFGYHSQFHIWNLNDHNCPGSVRVGQYKLEIIPEIKRRLEGGSVNPKNDIFDAVWKNDRFPAPDVDADHPHKDNLTWQAASVLNDIFDNVRETNKVVKENNALLKQLVLLHQNPGPVPPVGK